MYDLRVDGLRDLNRRTLFKTRKITRDPMSGPVDGSNRTFHSTFYPVQSSGSIQFHYSSGSVVGLSGTIDYDSGMVVFASAPSSQPLATYTYSEITDDERVDILMVGFDEMQTRWSDREFYLSSNGTTFVQALGTESNIYIVTKDASDVVSDPLSGGLAFSTQRIQVGFYILCCEYAYMANRAQQLATTAFRFREERGALIDQSRMPANIEAALERLDGLLDRVQEVASGQYYPEGEAWGGYVAPVATDEYLSTYIWQDDARDEGDTTS